jgi:uncharacterized protein YdeI (YjbR/CyaY-like superfamily)
MGIHDREHVECQTREQWRAWLASNADSSDGVWLITWKKHTNRPTLTYDEAVEEAIAFGWVDSRPGTVDDERSKGYYSPRKPTSAWSRTNKRRVEKLRSLGLMDDRGERAIRTAMENGAWTALDDVENLIEPHELASGLDDVPEARQAWESFPRGVKRGILEWISLAKKEETRRARIAETIAKASLGERANQWRP